MVDQQILHGETGFLLHLMLRCVKIECLLEMQCDCLCSRVAGLGDWVDQEEKRMWKSWAWSQETTEKMSGFGKQSFLGLFSSGHHDAMDLPWISPCGSVTGEPAWGWAGQKWATEGGGRSPQEEGTAARSGQCFFVLPECFSHVGMMVVMLFSDSGWEWGAEGRSLWSDRSTQFSSRGEPETPCQTGEPRAGPKAYARGCWAKAASGTGTWAGIGNPKVQTGWNQAVAAGSVIRQEGAWRRGSDAGGEFDGTTSAH